METRTPMIYLAAAAAMLIGTSSLAFAQNNFDAGQGYRNQEQNEGYGWNQDYRNQDQDHEHNSPNNQYNNRDDGYRNQGHRGDDGYSGDGYENQGSNQNWSNSRNRVSGRMPNHIRHQLQQEGFSNVHIAPGSYVVNAEDSNGDPVVMVIGPHSATMFRKLSNQNQMSSQNNSGQSAGQTNNDQGSTGTNNEQSSDPNINDKGNCSDEMAFLQNSKNLKITPAEREKVRRKIFNSLDQNGDGTVSRDEYVHCLVEAPKPAGNGAKNVK